MVVQRRSFLATLQCRHEQAAAVQIQACWRGHSVRSRLATMHSSAERLQAAWKARQQHRRCVELASLASRRLACAQTLPVPDGRDTYADAAGDTAWLPCMLASLSKLNTGLLHLSQSVASAERTCMEQQYDACRLLCVGTRSYEPPASQCKPVAVHARPGYYSGEIWHQIGSFALTWSWVLCAGRANVHAYHAASGSQRMTAYGLLMHQHDAVHIGMPG